LEGLSGPFCPALTFWIKIPSSVKVKHKFLHEIVTLDLGTHIDVQVFPFTETLQLQQVPTPLEKHGRVSATQRKFLKDN
jgi:hypothetical protein